ncbi:hypothetical protein [Halovenus salina]|uniref:HNH endonuclease n=1 Tax=Halovenus salina TaxID=1510225 RepID=A0ABD5W8F3_9EURY|nr:hypothetical protein [Halovenus salina]
MHRDQQVAFEGVLPSITARQNPFGESSSCSVEPVVLEAAEEDEVLQQRPVSILCSGCGDVITRYRDGIPSRLAHFEEECQTCETGLQRWSAVAIVTSLETAPSVEQLESVTTGYWDRHLWTGIMTGESYPRTEEYTEEYTKQAKQFGWEWKVRCPLCRRSLPEFGIEMFDYHHWHRDPDQGICLCRACHKGITGEGRDGTQDWRAQQLGLKNKHDLQLTRLAIREQVVSDHETLEGLVETVVSRYNSTMNRMELFALLSQTLTTSVVLDTVEDEWLLAALSVSQ